MFSAFQTFGRLGASASAAPFSPTKLFAAGEAGGVWDFTTLANLYQDSAGTTPCTTVGQTIGLVLDTKNGPPVLGPELVTNGDFSDGTTGWLLEGGWTITGGKAQNSGSIGGLTQTILTIGRSYVCTFTIDAVSNWLVGPNSVSYTATGTYTIIFVANSTTLRFDTQVAGHTATIDNISCKELPGNHLTQATSTKRPILGRMPATGVRNLLTYTTDLSNSVYRKQFCTVGSATTFSPVQYGNVSQSINTVEGQSYTVQFVVYAVSGNTALHILTEDSASGNETAITVTGTPAVYTKTFLGRIGGGIVYVGIQDRNASGHGVIYMSMPQCEIGTTATAYQKVVQPYDITESGVADVYTAYFDGVDDEMSFTEMSIAGTVWFAGKLTISAAYRNLMYPLVCSNGTDLIALRKDSDGGIILDTTLTILSPRVITYTTAAPMSVRVDGVLGASGATASSFTTANGVGNGSGKLGGFISALAVRGAATDAALVTSMEKWLAARTPGVSMP